VNAQGIPARMLVVEDTRAGCAKAGVLIEGIDAQCLSADRGYGTNGIVEKAEGAGIQLVIPPKKTGRHRTRMPGIRIGAGIWWGMRLCVPGVGVASQPAMPGILPLSWLS
jgi:hypothetical protein